MKHIIGSTLLPSALLAFGLDAKAETYELHRHKAWSVDLEVPDDSQMYCTAKTSNRSGDVVSMTAYADGGVIMFIFMAPDYEGWEGNFQQDAVVDIDYQRWNLRDAEFIGNVGMDTIIFRWEKGGAFKNFLTDLWSGNALALKTPGGGRSIAVWSLGGSAAALSALNDCFARIGLETPRVRM